eukprot:3798907-Prymnesium_polylepis.1
MWLVSPARDARSRLCAHACTQAALELVHSEAIEAQQSRHRADQHRAPSQPRFARILRIGPRGGRQRQTR